MYQCTENFRLAPMRTTLSISSKVNGGTLVHKYILIIYKPSKTLGIAEKAWYTKMVQSGTEGTYFGLSLHLGRMGYYNLSINVGILMEYNHFPTTFAIALVTGVGLYHEDIFVMGAQDERFEEADKFYGCIRNFQKLALFNSLEDSLIAYHGYDLTEEQEAALTIVHASSKTWALGHIAETLMIKLEDDPKNLGAIAQTLLEQLTSQGGTTPAVKRYVVNLAEIKE